MVAVVFTRAAEALAEGVYNQSEIEEFNRRDHLVILITTLNL